MTPSRRRSGIKSLRSCGTRLDKRVTTVTTNGAWTFVHDSLAREYGMFQLGDGRTPEEAALNFFLETRDHERALDFIELAFRYVDRVCRDDSYSWKAQPVVTADAAIE